jgi:hypothetical protein
MITGCVRASSAEKERGGRTAGARHRGEGRRAAEERQARREGAWIPMRASCAEEAGPAGNGARADVRHRHNRRVAGGGEARKGGGSTAVPAAFASHLEAQLAVRVAKHPLHEPVRTPASAACSHRGALIRERFEARDYVALGEAGMARWPMPSRRSSALRLSVSANRLFDPALRTFA